MWLASPQEVIERASLSISGAGPTVTMGSILNGITEIVQNLLDCSLEQNTRLDVFSYSIPTYRTVFRPFRFYLSSGFVDPTGFEIRESTYGDRITASGVGTLMDASVYSVDYIKGNVTFYEDITEGYGQVSIYYTNGFTNQDGLFTGVPDWLKQSAISAALRMYESHVSSTRSKTYRDAKNELATHVSMLINNHYRRMSSCFFPDLTAVDAVP